MDGKGRGLGCSSHGGWQGCVQRRSMRALGVGPDVWPADSEHALGRNATDLHERPGQTSAPMLEDAAQRLTEPGTAAA
eukprot:5715389-Prymnesium_polylepis.1